MPSNAWNTAIVSYINGSAVLGLSAVRFHTCESVQKRNFLSPRCPHFSRSKSSCHTAYSPGVYTLADFGSVQECAGPVDKSTTHSVLLLQSINVYNGIVFDTFLRDWPKNEFQFSWLARFPVSTSDIQPPICFAKQSREAHRMEHPLTPCSWMAPGCCSSEIFRVDGRRLVE